MDCNQGVRFLTLHTWELSSSVLGTGKQPGAIHTMFTFKIISYPDGARSVRAILHARGVEDAIERAKCHARLIGEYVDVECDGKCMAVCDGAGPAHGYGEFRYA